jgi:hypothetical protein
VIAVQRDQVHAPRTGAWPEDHSFADTGRLPDPPPKADGTPRAYEFGDLSMTSRPDVFARVIKRLAGVAPPSPRR